MDREARLAWALWWMFAFADVPPDVSARAYAEFERQYGRDGYVRYVEGYEREIERQGRACWRAEMDAARGEV